MVLEITREQAIKIIKSYYKIYENIDANVNIEVIKSYRGYFEDKYAQVNIAVETKKEVLGNTCILKSSLNEEEVKNIFEKVLQEENYDVIDLRYDAFIDIDENLCNSYEVAKFRGMEVEVKSNQKQKIK